MTQTRAQAAKLARLAEINSRHPDAVQLFTKGVESVLRQWTALELAVHHQWGGPKSADSADALVDEIVDLFLGPDKIYRDDIALLLEDYLDTVFFTVCEDGSTDDLGDKFCAMWRECIEGKSDIVTDVLSKEWMRHELQMVNRSEGLEAGDADDGSDDGQMNEAELELESALKDGLAAGVLGSIDESAAEMDEGDSSSADVPMKDPDGWETVARGKKASKKK